MTKREIKRELKRIKETGKFEEVTSSMNEEEKYLSIYLGSFLSLDPCGRYHHTLCTNNATAKCFRYWDNLYTSAEELECWIESDEDDPLDIFLCKH